MMSKTNKNGGHQIGSFFHRSRMMHWFRNTNVCFYNSVSTSKSVNDISFQGYLNNMDRDLHITSKQTFLITTVIHN